MKLVSDVSMLALESQSVIMSRVTMMATGRGTNAENALMISEKVSAATEAAMTMATGGSAAKVVRGYRKHVRANVKRLQRS
jgi:hypothetical protein